MAGVAAAAERAVRADRLSAARRFATGVLALACVAGAPVAVCAAGAWQTTIRAYAYPDLLAETDTVWCATGEAGLLRYARTTGAFDAFHREPGGLASNHLSALTRDRSGRLWVGTQDAGVSRRSADDSIRS